VDVKRFERFFARVADNVQTVIHGKDDVVRLSLVAMFANGHILFEDVPGTGKTVLARALAQSTRSDISRIQCTPDMLPGDITGSSIIETKTMKFVFRPGPVFANVLLVDEINRATPKTQSALLEAMMEGSVTIEGTSHRLPQPFLVLATQNPVELAGTFPLPEAQLDRFLFRLSIGYPDHDSERLVMRGNAVRLAVDDLDAVVDTKEVVAMIRLATEVKVPEAVETYIIDLVQATRSDAALTLGAGPRASINLLRAGRVMAASDGRDTVYPEDVKSILTPCLNHRMMLTPDAVLRGESVEDVVERVTSRIKVPLGVTSAKAPKSDGGEKAGAPAKRGARYRRTKKGARVR
jgi:MoxR-like ATPase